MLVNMTNFADTAALKKLAKVVIAHCAHRDYVQPYHDAFFAIDDDHSGMFSNRFFILLRKSLASEHDTHKHLFSPLPGTLRRLLS